MKKLSSILYNKKLKEACGDADLSIDVIPVDSYPLAHTDEDGRMFDYGDNKSDSHEGRMTKAKLSRIASMAQSLHDRLEDGDDLPEWVQDKITTSEDRISSAFDYIDYKIKNTADQVGDLECLTLEQKLWEWSCSKKNTV